MTTALAAPLLPATPPVPRGVQEPLIRIDGLTKKFAVRRRIREMVLHPTATRYTAALKSVTFDVRPGEFLGFLGPNGAGKTTLFKILATLVTPDSGSASIAGFNLARDPDGVRSVMALVNSEERSLNWRLSARENLRFFGALYGLEGVNLHRRIDEVLDVVELADCGTRMVGAFSSGMKQRLLIARALLPHPQILLLDEPTRSLDPIAARRFRRFLRDELTRRQGCTVLLATHNTEEALTLCDRVAVLHQGNLVALGVPRELSRQLGADRFQVWTHVPSHPVFTSLEREGAIGPVTRVPDTDGWSVVEFSLPGEEDRSAQILSRLVLAGAEVGRFQHVQPALADVLERIVRPAAEGTTPDA